MSGCKQLLANELWSITFYDFLATRGAPDSR
jgi:hypothetical protein